jgi:hypothetical protein
MVTRQITEDKIIHIRRNPWADNFFRPLLITAMIMCLNISIVNLVGLINPAWNSSFFLLAMLITTVEAIYSYRVLQYYRHRRISELRYRLAEATLLMVLLKILSLLDQPWPNLMAELELMWQAPSTILSTEFYITIMLAGMAWFTAANTIMDFESLYDPYTDSTNALNNLALRFFGGGAILVVISGITQWVVVAGVKSLVNWQRPILSGVIFNVLVYFVLGLVMLGQVNLTTHLVRWHIQEVKVTLGLAKRWAKYGLIFLGISAVIAFLLPTRYSLGLLATAGFVISFIIRLIVFLAQLILLLITLPFTWLLSLLGATRLESQPLPPPQPPPIFDVSAGTPWPWWEIIRSLVFWAVALGLIGYMIKVYLDDHPELAQHLKQLKLLGRLINLLVQLWRQLTSWAKAGLEMLPQLKNQKAASASGHRSTRPWNWFSLRGQSPRERILYYYLNILSRAEKRGLARKAHQTPYEYEPDLSQSIPTVESEIQDVTHIFVQARYSNDVFNEENAALVRIWWRHIRKALLQRKA